MADAHLPVVLTEYETRTVALSPYAARELAQLAGPKLDVRVGPRPGEWTITATQHVGTLVTPEITVLIRPKVRLDNLFLLLDVDLPAVAWGALPFHYQAVGDNLLAAFAALYTRTLERTVGNGLLRSYQEQTGRLVALRGRVLVSEVFRAPATPQPVPCTFDEYTADNDENRYLKVAAGLLARVPSIDHQTRQTLRRLLALFGEVRDRRPRPEELDRIVFTRLNRHYEPALRLSRLVLENLGLADRGGGHLAASFLLDMNELFQRWVTDRLRRHLAGTLVVENEPHVPLGLGGVVPMYPDLRFRHRDQVVYVGDVKYKLTNTGRARSADYYQLLAYTTALGLDEGLLIYSQVDGDVPEREVVVRRADTRLRTYALDLRGHRNDIEAAVAELASSLTTRALQLAQP